MIIIAGKIHLHPGKINAFLASSSEAMRQARRTPRCLEFIVAADPLEADRVNVFEHWQSEADLLSFRDNGMGDELSAMILRVDVHRHQITGSGTP